MKILTLLFAAFALFATFAEAAYPVPEAKIQFLDNSGNVLSGGKLYSYSAGTLTPKSTYTDAGGGTPNANPVVMDSAGRANVWLGSGNYKLILKTSADVTIWTVDNVPGVGYVNGDLTVTGNATIGGTLGVTGATSLTGNLAVNTNKFNVTASSGNTTVAGTLGVTGASTFGSTISSGAITATGGSVINSNSTSNYTFKGIKFSNDTLGGGIYLSKSRGVNAGENTIVQNGDELSFIIAEGANGSGYTNAARIAMISCGTPGASNDMPGCITFSTTPDGSGTMVERARINEDGLFLVGATTNVDISSSNTVGVAIDSLNNQIRARRNGSVVFAFSRGSSDGTLGQFYRDTTQVGSISVTTLATAYNTSSDKRIKRNAQPLDASSFFEEINPVTFKWIKEYSTKDDAAGVGLMAQELYKIAPEAVTKGDDGMFTKYGDEGFSMWQVDYSKLVPYLLAEVKAHRQKIKTLEAVNDNFEQRIKELERKVP